MFFSFIDTLDWMGRVSLYAILINYIYFIYCPIFKMYTIHFPFKQPRGVLNINVWSLNISLLTVYTLTHTRRRTMGKGTGG